LYRNTRTEWYCKRKHQHILNVTRALLFQANLPSIFWHFAVLHDVLLINCIPTPLLQNMTPYEKLNGTLYDISSLRVFGYLCYSSTVTSHRKKLDDRVVSSIFLGFQPHTKGYLFLNLQNHKIKISRHIVFYEHHFPYKMKDDDNEGPNNLSLSVPQSYVSTYDFFSDNNNTATETMIPTETAGHNSPRRSTRVRRTPTYLADFHTDMPYAHTVSSKYPVNNFVSYHALSSNFQHTIASFSSSTEPQNYEDASKHDCWKEAVAKELTALSANNTWTLVPLPLGKKAIGCRWVYKVKHRSDGTIEHYKAHLVAKGYAQLEGLDFLDTFAPVVKLTTLRLLLALAASHKWFLKQLDVNNAFLHGDLLEEVYMKPPPGINVPNPHIVCKLQRSLYGLRQASRQ